MKLSEKWLHEWVNPKKTIAEITEQLTMAGIEIEGIVPAANNFRGVVVGEVLEVKPHPDADRLRICQVNVGKREPLTIICGASNVKAGLKVPAALIDAVLSPELTIKKAKLRGVESYGMLCGAVELGLGEKAEGLMVLPADAPIGKDLREYLQLDDHILELKVTPNRGDCLSVAGIAREAAVVNECAITPPIIKNISASITDQFPVEVQAKEACPRYVGRIIRNLNPHATTPLWMQERLRRSGIRSIYPVVDIANYVMLELGEPLHAFDLSKLAEKIIVRYAKPLEKIKLLDGKEIPLDKNTLVIADAKQVQVIAGIMGGLSSGVSATTIDIFLESAFFAPLTIAKSVQRYNLQSDSSQRFERGVDPELQVKAIQRATELIIGIAGGKAGPLTEVTATEKLPKLVTIQLRKHRIQRILGISIPDKTVENILTRLGIQVKPQAEGWQIIPPSYRFDIATEIDVIEELIRIYGYNRVPTIMPSAELKTKINSETHLSLNKIRSILVNHDYHEIISYSFVSAKLQNLLDPENSPIALANPMSADMDVMRTNLWPGLIQAALYNQNRQESRIRLFETGLCFTKTDAGILQQDKLGGIAIGDFSPEQWGRHKAPLDYFDIKNDLQTIFGLTKDQNYSFKPCKHPALHPHKSATIYRDQQPIGYLGALHPDIEKKLEILSPIYLFELSLSGIQSAKLPLFEAISKFPMVRRDIAIVLDRNTPAAEIEAKIFNSANELLKNVQLFDIYLGKGIDLGKKSVALGLIFQHPTRTLQDTEINDQVNNIVKALEREFSAKLRE